MLAKGSISVNLSGISKIGSGEDEKHIMYMSGVIDSNGKVNVNDFTQTPEQAELLGEHFEEVAKDRAEFWAWVKQERENLLNR